MTTIYLINNSLTLNNLVFPSKDHLEQKREKRILSIKGEEEAKKLANHPELQQVNAIYTSSYVMTIGTAKYLAQKLELEMNISSQIGEAMIGDIGSKSIRMIRELQETDFDYRLPGGESLNMVKSRMYSFLMQVLKEHQDQNIAIFTHNVAITCLLSNWCTKGFNLDNRLILNFEERAIVDGSWDGITMIKMEFNGENLMNIEK